MLSALGDVPAMLVGYRTDVLVASPEFARLWARHTVRQCHGGIRHFRHPLAGSLILTEEVMELTRDRGQHLVIFSAEPGTPSQDGLRLLAALTAEAGQGHAGALRALGKRGGGDGADGTGRARLPERHAA